MILYFYLTCLEHNWKQPRLGLFFPFLNDLCDAFSDLLAWPVSPTLTDGVEADLHTREVL